MEIPMRVSALGVLVAFVALKVSVLAGTCVPIAEARQYIGKTQCVRGTVVQVKQGRKGVTFLDFCEDYRACPFTAVVFAGDLKHVGDVRQLKGRTIELLGTVREYDGRAEIILRNARQLGKDAASLLPPLPKDYDVARRGHYSAGKFSYPRQKNKSRASKQGTPVEIEEPENP